MIGQLNGLGPMAFKILRRLDRSHGASGELPHAKPARPQGVERNIVVTLRDWMNEKQYLHDLISSDRRNPTVNANGPLYGSPEYSSDVHPDSRSGQEHRDDVQGAGARRRHAAQPGTGHAAALKPLQPSPYWGDEAIWDTRVNNHNSMFDRTRPPLARGRGARAGQSGVLQARARSTRRPRRFRSIARCGTSRCSIRRRRNTRSSTPASRTHHLQFGYDANDTLWTSGGGPVVGWLNTKMFDETGDAAKSQGWTALVLDTNGNGKRDAYVEPDHAARSDEGHANRRRLLCGDAEPGRRFGLGRGAGRSPARSCGSIPASNPPATALAEIYNVPNAGFGVRGADIDRKGVVWVSLGSGHLGSFDRRKCKGR